MTYGTVHIETLPSCTTHSQLAASSGSSGDCKSKPALEGQVTKFRCSTPNPPMENDSQIGKSTHGLQHGVRCCLGDVCARRSSRYEGPIGAWSGPGTRSQDVIFLGLDSGLPEPFEVARAIQSLFKWVCRTLLYGRTHFLVSRTLLEGIRISFLAVLTTRDRSPSGLAVQHSLLVTFLEVRWLNQGLCL